MIEKFLGTYSNGWGHLIFSCVIFAMSSLLLASGHMDVTIFSLVNLPMITFWFGNGLANQMGRLQSIIKQQQDVISPPAQDANVGDANATQKRKQPKNNQS